MSDEPTAGSVLRTWLWRSAKAVLVGGILAYLLVVMFRQWGEVRGHVRNARVAFLLAAAVLQGLAMLSMGLLWRGLMAALGMRVTVASAVRMQWLSALGKYVPGKVGAFIGRVYLAGPEGCSRDRIVLCCLYEVLFCFIAPAFLVLLSLACGGVLRGALLRLLAVWLGVAVPLWVVMASALLLIVLLLVCAHPRVLLPLVNWVLARLKRPALEGALGYRRMLAFSVGYTAPFVLGGAAEFAVLRAFYDMPLAYVADLIGLLSLVTPVGFAVLLAPAGLGVREFLLASVLGWLPGVTRGGAVFVALAGRALTTLTDFAGAAIALAMYAASRRKPRGGTPA